MVMIRKSTFYRLFHILSLMLLLGFALCLVSGFADEEGDTTNPLKKGDIFIPEGNPEFPTAEGPEYIQDIGGFRLAPNFVFGPEQFEKMRDPPPR